jgi:hypothetical protein
MRKSRYIYENEVRSYDSMDFLSQDDDIPEFV